MATATDRPAADIGILLIHGIGAQPKGWAHKPMSALRGALGAAGLRDRVAVGDCWWAPATQAQQSGYRKRMQSAGFPVGLIRRFVLDNLGDPAAYRVSPGQDPRTSAYYRAQRYVGRALERLAGRMQPDAPLLILAHSFGGVVITDYLWNQQNRAAQVANGSHQRHVYGSNPISRGETFAGLVSIGCNLPLFETGRRPFSIIKLPDGKRFTPWLNLWAASDPLGWPLAPLGELMEDGQRKLFAERVKDQQVTVGSWWQSWNAASHTAYWGAKPVLQPLVERVRSLLNA